MIDELRRKLGHLVQRCEGASAIEFAFVGPVLLLLVVGSMELGMIFFASSLLQGGIREAARFGITGAQPDGPVNREQHLVEVINEHGAGVVNVTAADIATLIYPDFSSIGEPEPFVDRNGNNIYDAGEPYTDVNCNDSWDPDMGRAGLGVGGEVVLYRASFDKPLLTGFLAPMIGKDGRIRLEASVAVRNEPFDGGAEGC